jgi:hypothetical protein
MAVNRVLRKAGNRKGWPIARQRTRYVLARFLFSQADPGGGSDRPHYENKNGECCDRHRQYQPALDPGFVHTVLISLNVFVTPNHRKQ